MKQIVSGVLIVFLAFGLLSCSNITLAPGSYFATNSISFGHFKSSLSEREHRLSEVPEFPDGSIYKPTDDFELITENLPKPIITRGYIEDFEFIPWVQKTYDATGKLEKGWSYNINTTNNKWDKYIVNRNTRSSYWQVNATDFDYDDLCSSICFDPKNGSIIKGDNLEVSSVLGLFFKPIHDFDNNLVLKIHGNYISLENFKKRTFWYSQYTNIKYDKINLISVIDDNILMGTEENHVVCLDASTGFTKWILKNTNEGVYLRETYEYGGYLWVTFARNHIVFGNSYRINPQTLEIAEIKIDDSWITSSFWWWYDKSFCYIDLKNDSKSMMVTDIESGILKKKYSDEKLINSITSTKTMNPFILLRNSSITLAEINFYNPNNNELIDIAKISYSKRFDPNYSPVSQNYENLSDYIRKDDIIRYGYNENRIFGFDMDAAQKTWWIDSEEAGEDAIIQIVDQNGVLISNGSVITCYGAPEGN
ncbi:MAG: hypothetical protein KAH30_03990 [Caldisericia bacterium]|nr:hypothetical protein [Caldisericia bacterium]